jgi:predicted RND superfamily exporter protein
MMTIGMVVGFITVFLFIPAVSSRLKGIRVIRRAGNEGERRQSRGLVRLLERATLARPVAILLLSAAVLLVAVEGVRRLSAESKITSYFWPGSEVYQGLEFIDQNLGGTTWIEVILRSGEEGYFGRKAGLDAIALAESYFEGLPETGNVLSLTKVRDEMRKTLRREWFPVLPDSILLKLGRIASPELIGQTANADFTVGRSTIRMKETAPTLNRKEILEGLQRHLAAHPEVFGKLNVEVTGIFPVYSQILETLLEGQKWSAVAVPLAVYLMLIILFRSPLLALIVLIPQALPATVLLGIMGWVGIPLDLVTVMIASIAIGVGIDAAIQYTMRFRTELELSGGDRREALRRAHATVGRAIWIATSIIVAGFAILVLSEFFPSVWFGLFTALAMLISQLATLSVLPSLFLLTGYPRLKQGRGALAIDGADRLP